MATKQDREREVFPGHDDFPGEIDGIAPEPGFDVTVETVIGHVTLSGNGKQTVLEAAFGIIARNAKDGTYRWPGPHQDTWTVVTVEGIE